MKHAAALAILLALVAAPLASGAETIPLWGRWEHAFTAGPSGMAMKHAAALAILLALVAAPLAAGAETIPLWGRWDHAFAAGPTVSPDTEFSVDLTSPSGKVSTVAGFWDGERTWRVRFMPEEAGRWQYRTHSHPTVEGLDGRSGEFVSQPGPTTTPFLRHGPVRVSANRRFFEHADGTPFFWMGDTVWYGAILSSRVDWDTYLTDRAAKRFTVVHFNVVAPRNGVAADEHGEISFSGGLGHLQAKPRLDRMVIQLLAWAGLYSEPPIRMNPRFYRRLDERIDAVNTHGLLAVLVLTWAVGPTDSGNALPESEVVRVVRYLEARYGAHHVMWIMTGDIDYEGAAEERWKRIGRAAFGGKIHRPVTTHPARMRWPWDRFARETWLDFIVYQSGHDDDDAALRWIHSGPPRQRWRDPPARPFINIEPPYEGHLGWPSRRPHSDFATRRAIYWSLLNAPTAGVTYGAHGVWSWHTAVGQPPTDHPNTGVAKTWREALQFPGSTQMKYLHELFGSIQWWSLRPDDDLLAEQPGGDDPAAHVSASRSDDGRLAVLYLPVGVTLRLSDRVLRGPLRSEWFDPRTGRRMPARTPAPGVYAAPDQRDWVLLLRRPS